jgi:hypothetical protein
LPAGIIVDAMMRSRSSSPWARSSYRPARDCCCVCVVTFATCGVTSGATGDGAIVFVTSVFTLTGAVACDGGVTTGAVAATGAGVGAGVGVGDGVGVTVTVGAGVGTGVGAGVGVGPGVTVLGGVECRTVTGVECPSTCAGALARCSVTSCAGATAGNGATTACGTVVTCGLGSGRARTMAGAVACCGTANDGVWPPPGPARKRGNAAAPATAPARRTAATTPFVIPLMVPTQSADYLTRKGYRQVGTRA